MLSHHTWLPKKTIVLTRQNFVSKVMSLFFNMLSRFVIAFLRKSKHFLISWLQTAVILECKKIKSVMISIVSHLFAMTWWDWSHDLSFWMLSFKAAFSLSSFTSSKRLFNSSSLSAVRVVSPAYLKLLIFLPAILIPVYTWSSPAFCIVNSAYKLNKQAYNIWPNLECKKK